MATLADEVCFNMQINELKIHQNPRARANDRKNGKGTLALKNGKGTVAKARRHSKTSKQKLRDSKALRVLRGRR